MEMISIRIHRTESTHHYNLQVAKMRIHLIFHPRIESLSNPKKLKNQTVSNFQQTYLKGRAIENKNTENCKD